MIELFLSQLLNGLVIGSVYALIALGFSLVFGVANLINFAQGALLMLGAFFAFTLIQWGVPIVAAGILSVVATAAVGMLVERLALRPLRNAPAIAPLLSTLAIAVIADAGAELIWSAESQPFPSPLQSYVVFVGGAFLTGVDIATFVISLAVMGGLMLFLSRSWTGRALRATAQDPEAAAQMGIDVALMRQIAFGMAGALGALAGILVAMYYQSVFPQMGVPFGIKGFAAALLGGLASIPGAVLGGFLLGIFENLASGYVGEGSRDLIAYSLLILVLMVRPQGLLGTGKLEALGGVGGASGAIPTTSIVASLGGATARTRDWVLRPKLGMVLGVMALAALLPLFGSAYVVQVAAGCAVFAMLALSLTLLSGSAGVISIGHAALFGFGAYVCAILGRNHGWPVEGILLAAAFGTAAMAALATLPAIRLTGHAVALATLAVGQVGYLLFLNWIELTRGPMGIAGIQRGSIAGLSMQPLERQYWLALLLLAVCYVIAHRLLESPIGRTWRAIREDRPAAHAAGVPVTRYLVMVAAVAGLMAGLAGAQFAWLQAFVSPDSFILETSIVLISMVVLGGMGNIAGAVIAGVLLAILPEALRAFEDWRMIVYGLILLGLLRLRPQGLGGVR